MFSQIRHLPRHKISMIWVDICNQISLTFEFTVKLAINSMKNSAPHKQMILQYKRELVKDVETRKSCTCLAFVTFFLKCHCLLRHEVLLLLFTHG